MYKSNYVLGRRGLGAVNDDFPTPAPTVIEEVKKVAVSSGAKTAGIGALLGYFLGGKKTVNAVIGAAVGFFGGKYLKRGVPAVADDTGKSEIQVIVDALNEINPEGIYAPSEVESLRSSSPANYWTAAMTALEEANEDQFYALKLDEEGY